MHLLRRCLAALGGSLVLLLLAVPVHAAAEAGPHQRRAVAEDGNAEARVIVKYRADSALVQAKSAGGAALKPRHAAEMGARLGLALVDRHVLGARTQSLSGTGVSAAELARRLAALPDVEWAVPVRRKFITSAVPNDPYYGPNQTSITPLVGQWYLRKYDSTFVSAIDAEDAWAITTGQAAVTVAVLDTGITPHVDLLGKYYPGYDFVSRTSSAADGDGVDGDATDPGDWNAADGCGSGSDASNSSWHGTQTAGIIGASTDNNLGMASVGRNVRLLPVRVLGQCGGYDDDIIAGMRWAAGLSSSPVANAHRAKVLNMSLGASDGSPCDSAYTQVFNELYTAGVTVVVAAGNDEGLALSEPANCTHAVTVVALRHAGTKVGFSDVGPTVTIAAPGGNCVNLSGPCLYPILTTTNAGTTTATAGAYSSSLENASLGTSFSAPMVAGTVALMLSVDPTLTPAAIASALRATARPFPTSGSDATVQICHAPNGVVQDECYCTTQTCGAGMLNVAAAVAAVVPAVVPPPAPVLDSASMMPTAGDAVALDGSYSGAYGGRTIVAYQWQLTAGSEFATLSGIADASTATLNTTAAGPVTVQLTVTDSAGASASQTQVLTVKAPAPPVVPPAPAPAPSSGGGAMSLAWLAGLMLAVALLAQARARRPRPGAAGTR